MKQVGILLVLGIFCLLAEATAQGPIINSEQTVNPATGEMSFSLPLGTVKGINGQAVPINLGYKAGIKYHQQASTVGLGFDINMGSIVRKTVFVPDDAIGGQFYHYNNEDPECLLPKWLSIILDIGSMVSTVFFAGADIVGGWLGTSLSAVGWTAVLADLIVPTVAYSTADFNAGGTHNPEYAYGRDNGGNGFFYGGDALGLNYRDMPDIYILNAPGISGELVWIGHDGATENFILRSSTGAAEGLNYNTVKIFYNRLTKIFQIHLPNGDRLFFEKTTEYGSYQMVRIKQTSGLITCDGAHKYIFQYENTPAEWHLTKILYNDYIDGNGTDDPLDPNNDCKGTWVCYQYIDMTNQLPNRNIYQPVASLLQSSPSSIIQHQFIGKTDDNHVAPKLQYLKAILTQNETAQFNYTFDRKDNLWFYYTEPVDYTYGSDPPVETFPRLTSVNIISKNNSIRSTIEFHQNYDLRPCSQSAYTKETNHVFNAPLAGNTDAGSLTLNYIQIKNGNTSRYC